MFWMKNKHLEVGMIPFRAILKLKGIHKEVQKFFICDIFELFCKISVQID